MDTQLTYTDKNGKQVKTSQFLRNRGSCCKTACRHCPYGFTLKEKGLQFSDYSPQQKAFAEKFLQDVRGPVPHHDIALSLLSEGFGEKKKVFSLEDHPIESLKFILLKERIIGLARISEIQVKNLFLDKHYQNQGIDIPVVESFYF